MSSNSYEKYQKRKLRSSYISVIISISLVLFVIGLLGLLVLKTQVISDKIKEKVAITLFLKDDVTSDQRKTLQEKIEKEPYSRKVIFVSKNQAAKDLKKDLGEDFIQFLGNNPLKNSLDIYMNAAFVSTDQIESIEKELSKNAFYFDISYDKPLIQLLTKNIQQASFWILVLSGFLTLVAVILINSSIRLSVYSKRFTIKTMQMVGATKHFIRKPFIWKSIQLGFLGAILANIGMGICIYYLNLSAPTLHILDDKITLLILAGSIFGLGIIITWISTFLATQRFLNLKTEDLYY